MAIVFYMVSITGQQSFLTSKGQITQYDFSHRPQNWILQLDTYKRCCTKEFRIYFIVSMTTICGGNPATGMQDIIKELVQTATQYANRSNCRSTSVKLYLPLSYLYAWWTKAGILRTPPCIPPKWRREGAELCLYVIFLFVSNTTSKMVENGGAAAFICWDSGIEEHILPKVHLSLLFRNCRNG